MSLKLHFVRHFIHYLGKNANIGEHDIGWTYGSIKNDLVDKVTKGVKTVIQHIEIHVELAVVGLHLQAVKMNAFRRNNRIGLEFFKVKTTEFLGFQIGNRSTNGIAKHIKITGFQEDVVKVEMRIIHEMVGGLQRIGLVLVPKHEVDILQGNLVNDDFHGLRCLLFRLI